MATWGYFEAVRGCDTPVDLTLPGVADSDPVTVTGRDEGGVALFAKSTGAGTLTHTAGSGVWSFVLTEADSLAILSGQHEFDVRITTPGAKEVLILDGFFTVKVRAGVA